MLTSYIFLVNLKRDKSKGKGSKGEGAIASGLRRELGSAFGSVKIESLTCIVHAQKKGGAGGTLKRGR